MARDFSTDELREAILHLVHLAACYEGRQPDVQDERSHRKFAEIVAVVAPDLARTQQDALRSVTVDLTNRLGELYRDHKLDSHASAYDLEQRVKDLFQEYKIEVTEDGLDELVPSQEEITEAGGPMDCARSAVATVFGVQMRSIANWKAENPLVLPPLAFSRRMGRTGIIRYVLSSLLGFTTEETKQVLRQQLASRNPTA